MSLYLIDRLAQVLADGSSDAVTVFGITLVGVSVTTAVKLMFTVGLVVVVLGLRWLALFVTRRVLGGEVADPRRFWVRQGVQLVAAATLAIGFLFYLGDT
ncbi:hypothetical protein [Nakamurella multipartita]|uniref:hypothetical protein n=1 Tax=Nakamurella multipartita TaxID=53461 RepID=UPI00019E962C|nr:hypothetical protein [Nakamurella multipartita]